MAKHYVMQLLRETNRFSAGEVAEKMGVPTAVYVELEEGRSKLTQEHIEALGKLYGVKTAYLEEPSIDNEVYQLQKRTIALLEQSNNRLREEQETQRRKAREEEEEEDSREAYAVIEEWFEAIHFDAAREDLDYWFEAAIAGSYVWNDGPPSNCLWLHDQMLILIGAAHELWQVVEEKDQDELPAVEIVLPAMRDYLSYPDDYPRLLTANEWKDPISALCWFFEYKDYDEWVEELHVWLDAALSNASVTENTEVSEMMPFCRQLHRLVEACYVIKIQRERSSSFAG